MSVFAWYKTFIDPKQVEKWEQMEDRVSHYDTFYNVKNVDHHLMMIPVERAVHQLRYFFLSPTPLPVPVLTILIQAEQCLYDMRVLVYGESSP